jgi:hypothetical protein
MQPPVARAKDVGHTLIAFSLLVSFQDSAFVTLQTTMLVMATRTVNLLEWDLSVAVPVQ